MTTNTTALVRQMREAMQGFLNIVGDSRGVDGYNLNGAIAELDEFPEVEAAESAIAADDQWLAQQRGPLMDEGLRIDAERYRFIRDADRSDWRG